MSSEEAAYLAGLIDGEGTVTLTKREKSAQRSIVITIANTERCLLEFTLSIVGVGRISSKLTYKENHTPSYVYQVSGRQALTVLEQIVPFMHSYKKERAILALSDYIRLTPRNGRYSQKQFADRELFVKDFFALTAK